MIKQALKIGGLTLLLSATSMAQDVEERYVRETETLISEKREQYSKNFPQPTSVPEIIGCIAIGGLAIYLSRKYYDLK